MRQSAQPGPERGGGGGGGIELKTKVAEDFTITKKAPTRAFSWLKAPVLTL